MISLMVLLVAQAAAPRGLTLRELQERARKNDPRAMQAVAQLENARGKSDEAKWAFFSNFQTTAYLAGPTPERRLKLGDTDKNPTNTDELTDGSTGGGFHGKEGATGHVDIKDILPLWTCGRWPPGKRAAGHRVQATEALFRRPPARP